MALGTSHLKREKIVYELQGADRNCDCGQCMREIGETISETLKVIPAQMIALQHIRKKYVCSSCESSFKTAPMTKQPIPGSIASPSLLAHIATGKYVDGLPLYRQEAILRRTGVDLKRATLANWMIKMGSLVQPLINLILERIIASKNIVMDETRVQVLKEKNRKAKNPSFMWCMVGLDPSKVGVIFHYSPTRSAQVAFDLLTAFEGNLITDGYAGYKSVSGQLRINHAGCWAHCRRYFHKAYLAGGQADGIAKDGLAYIARLFRIDARYKNCDDSRRYVVRDLYARGLIREIEQWLRHNINCVTPKSATGKALNYMAGEWDGLVRFLKDGSIPITNEKAENAIRPFVVGRKNWLFSQSVGGAEASANLYSLIESAKANGKNPHQYLTEIFTELPSFRTIDDLEKLLPWT